MERIEGESSESAGAPGNDTSARSGELLLVPAGKALVDAFPIAVLGGQVFPMSAATRDPKNTVHENPVVPGGYPHRPGTPRQKYFNATPLRSAHFVPRYPRLPYTSLLAPELHSTSARRVLALPFRPGFVRLSIRPGAPVAAMALAERRPPEDAP